MRYRWDPAYPMGRRTPAAYDTNLRASDAERNEVADKLSRHFAEGRLDQAEFKTRLDIAMSATTRGDLVGLFSDLPRLTTEPPPPPPRHRRLLPFLFLIALLSMASGVTWTFWHAAHVPWVLVFVIAFFFWHRYGRSRHHHHHRGRPVSSSVLEQ